MCRLIEDKHRQGAPPGPDFDEIDRRMAEKNPGWQQPERPAPGKSVRQPRRDQAVQSQHGPPALVFHHPVRLKNKVRHGMRGQQGESEVQLG